MAIFQVNESIFIAAEPAKVRACVRDFKQWNAWSPWVVAEPDCAMTYDADGKGYGWDGKIIGAGQMRIDAERDEGIDYTLTFLRPFKSVNKTSFAFAAAAGGTTLSWHMQGSLPFFMFFMKKMMSAWISADFRRGLAKLKDVVEAGAAPSQLAFAGVGGGVSTAYIGISGRSRIADIGPAMTANFERLNAWLKANDVPAAGAPLSIYHKFHVVSQETEYTAAIPVGDLSAAAIGALPSDIKRGTLNAPRTYKIVHTGAYRHLANAWAVGMMHGRAKLFAPKKGLPSFEAYVDAPVAGDDATRKTEVHFPAN